jgi:hypothetical protein
LLHAFLIKGRAMSTENWHEERDRLVQLLEGIDSGDATHVDQED